MQREAVLHGEPTSAAVQRQPLGQAQALLNGALLQDLVLVFGQAASSVVRWVIGASRKLSLSARARKR